MYLAVCNLPGGPAIKFSRLYNRLAPAVLWIQAMKGIRNDMSPDECTGEGEVWEMADEALPHKIAYLVNPKYIELHPL
jgi:hypothetical protein